ncbi:MAG: aspartate ammonia-lyase, partial [Bacteroidales bacterium]|nr:aspartate ammonia-lyase [Bacteroidales bacterium]
MQEALPSTFGLLFSAYNDALSRDWWRVSKCFERIKQVNLGGTATGSAMAVPRYYVMNVCRTLAQITNLPITRAENMGDATSNLDTLVEVHAILKAHAVNLEKLVSDLRLLGSSIARPADIGLPKRQAGSSIMPGKVNPVIPEYVVSIAHKVYANDQLITGLSAQGCLELNAYLPVIGHALLESIKMLIAAGQSAAMFLLKDLEVNETIAYQKLIFSPAISTVLLPYLGYHKATEIAVY